MKRFASLIIGMSLITALCPASDLAVGQSLDGALDASDAREEQTGLHDSLTLALDGSSPTVIDLSSDDFDTFLRVTLPDGTQMEDDDGGGNRNSRVIAPPAVGEATLTVMSFSGSATGAYSIAAAAVAVERAEAGTPFLGMAEGGVTTVMLGVTEGETLLIDVVSDVIDPTLTLTGPGGVRLFDDDGGEGFNSRLIFTPAADGDATLLIADFAGGSGPFTLSAQPLVPEGTIAVGETLAGTLATQAQPPIYTLTGEPGTRVLIHLDSLAFDTVLTGVNERGELSTNDDIGSGTNSRLGLRLPESGTAFFMVGSFDGRGGPFTVRTTIPPPPVLPQFTLQSVEGEAVSSTAFDGQVRLVNLWATWCPPCVAELPDLNALHHELAGRGLAVIGISVDDTAREVLDFLEETPLDFPILMDDRRVSEMLGALTDTGMIEGVPTTFIVDRQGEVREIFLGMRSLEVFRAAVEPLLSEAD